ncbi:beta-lactamase induction signal transducer [Pectobacterium atrosepticum SCRI1043]|uniref:Anhydromuropeptide permease n=1 Tax=Pectobacterium atrosepticum (strain SCRI 1043 / ATCC BAA-672) TaxID=218491 RepID=Q6D831_PECAS|nr:muropeptide MFS transporter AmpG [Pectobacterium atrosepticum]GKV86323.1 AmpG family muropeptide MFS transporter [Pectobacterium carotovorum subsp. carotovorum]AIA70104.1 muropeptide transporter [Pectobacterium atrosepticum]AIK13024.1 beta-lactamase induction signal transducer [Pectobacterium atrosepticum]ATY89939.1 muropeptide transporter AmpG [Pectobacterium atrosepticum]KFX16850.1 muropeptide transporter [Pectobacterium atrosepticum]
MFSRIITLFSQRNSLFMLLLGFASGLPLALTSGTLQAWMTIENVDLKTIGFFSLVGQAYVFKFLWSPLMDRYTPPFLGRRRGWLILSQLLLIVAIIGMGFMNPTRDLLWLATLAVLVAFCSASQDIVFDAYKTDLLPPEERGTGAATSVLGYRLAMLVSGGLALWMADRYFGWQATYWLMAGLMLIGVFATLLAPEPLNSQPAPRTMEQAIVAPLRDFFERNNAWLILLLIVLYKLGDAFAVSLTTTFLIRGVGFNAGDVGLVNKTLGLFATIVGAIYGGLLMQRLSLFRALMLFGLLQAVSNAGYWLLAITDKNLFTMASAVFLENLCGGMGTAAFVALLMTLCNKSFSATQFALLSALAAVGRVYVGPIAGWFVESYGWAWFYLFSIFAALPGLAILMICRETLEFTQKTDTFQLRTNFQNYYKKALRVLGLGVILLVLWLILLISNALEWSSFYMLAEYLLTAGCTLALLGIFFGSLLDYLSLRRASKPSVH